MMEAEALTTYTSTRADGPESLDPEAAVPVVSETVVADSQPIGPEISEVPADANDKTFASFGIAEPICAALEAEGITTAFPIQALTLPVALERP